MPSSADALRSWLGPVVGSGEPRRRLTGREVFAQAPSRGAFGATLAITLALELLRSPGRLREAAALLRGSRAARALRFHYLVIQDAPAYDEETGASVVTPAPSVAPPTASTTTVWVNTRSGRYHLPGSFSPELAHYS